MEHELFIRHSHKNIKAACVVLYLCFFVILSVGMLAEKSINWLSIVFLVFTLFLIVCMANLFEHYGIYIDNGKIYYQTLKRKEIDVRNIVGVKIIKAEGQVNIAWSSFDMKDKSGKILYSMIFLSKIEEGMKDYPYGDIEFLRKYKNSIIMHSVYDERLIEFLKHKTTIEILMAN